MTNQPQLTPLQQAHRDLLQEVLQLESVLPTAGQQAPAELEDRLVLVRSRLNEHFRLEEKDGYLSPVLDNKPWLNRKIDELLSQHAELEQELN